MSNHVYSFSGLYGLVHSYSTTGMSALNAAKEVDGTSIDKKKGSVV